MISDYYSTYTSTASSDTSWLSPTAAYSSRYVFIDPVRDWDFLDVFAKAMKKARAPLTLLRQNIEYIWEMVLLSATLLLFPVLRAMPVATRRHREMRYRGGFRNFHKMRD